MKKLLLVVSAFLLFGYSNAQKTQIYRALTDGGPGNALINLQSNTAPTDAMNLDVLPTDGSSSQNSRAPSNYWKAQRTEYLIRPAEMAACGFPSGAAITSIGFSIIGDGTGGSNSGTLKIYLKNTTDATYTLGSNWTVTGFTQTCLATWTVPITSGVFNITFTGGSAFTYTGSGVYVAWEFVTTGTAGSYPTTHACNTALTNGLYGMRGTAVANGLTASPYRPETYFGSTSYNDYLAVTNVYTLERAPYPYGTPTPVGIRVSNVSTSAQTFNVTLTVKDVATSTTRYTSTQAVTALAAGASTVVNFTGWSPTIAENVNITGSVPILSGETFTVNNTKTISGNVNTNLFSYNYTTTGSSGYGFTYPATGIFAAKYTMTGTGQITGANVVISTSTANTGNSVQAVVLNSSGIIVTQSAAYTILAGDLGTNKNFTFSTPAVFSNESYYVGLLTTAGTVQWYPIGIFTETPPRGNTFYSFPVTGGTPSAEEATIKYGIEAQVAAYTGPLNPSNFVSEAVNYNEIDLTWNLNPNSNNVLLAWSLTGTFGTPVNGTVYTPGSSIPGGGTVLQYGSGLSFDHSGLTGSTHYYYKAWSYTGSQYSVGAVTNTTTLCTPVPAPWTQNFEAATFPPTCWESYSGSGAWARVTTASGYGTGTASVNADFFNIQGTDPFDLLTLNYSNGTLINPRLAFDYAYATFSGEVDEMDILYSTDYGLTWSYLYFMYGGTSGELNTGGTVTSAFIPTAAQWKTKYLSLPAGTNKVAFEAISAYGNDLFLDNVKIVESVAHDVALESIDSPTINTVANTIVTPKATVINLGTNTETFNVTMTIAGGYSSTKTVTALAPAATQEVTFDNWTPAVGQYLVSVCTALAGDLEPTNDCSSGTAGVYTGAWTTGADYPTTTYLGTGVGYVDHSGPSPVGYLFSIGGNTASTLGTECYKYNCTTNTWSPIASLPAGRRVLASACVGNYIYAIGGSDMASVIQTTVYKYDIAGNSWSTVAPLPVATTWGKAVSHGNYIYFAGGTDGTNIFSTVYVYNVTANSWTTATSMPGVKYGGAFSCTGNFLVYVAGADGSGINNVVYVGTIDAGNPALISWAAKSSYPGNNLVAQRIMDIELTSQVMPKGKARTLPENQRAASYPAGAMYRFDGAPWGTDRIIVAGGSPTSGWYAAYPNPCYSYNPVSDLWVQQPYVENPVTGASLGSVNLSSGSTHTWKLILAGGIDAFGIESNYTQILTDEVTEPLAHDVGVHSINVNPVINLGITPTATVKNYGTSTESFNVTMTIGAYTSTKSVTSLAPAAASVVTFDPWSSTIGDFSVNVCTSLSGDLEITNNCKSLDLKVLNLDKQVYGYIAATNSVTDAIGPATFNLASPDNLTTLNPQGTELFVSGGTWANGIWYATVYNTTAPYNFITIDPVTGLRTVIGDMGVGINGLAYNVADGLMYGVGYTSPDSKLYTIDLATGSATLVSTLPGMLLINLAIDNLGNCYSLDIVADMMVKIDLPAGTYTTVGSTGFSAFYAQDMEFDRSTGNLFIAAYDGDNGWLGWVSTTTGTVLKVADFDGGAEVTGFAIPYSAGKTLSLTSLFLEGLYAGSGTMNPAYNDMGLQWPDGIADHINVELHNSTSYATIEYTAADVELSTTGDATVEIPSNIGDSYYITIRHRNSVETPSAEPVDFSGTTIDYAWDSQSQAYGDNMGLMVDGTAVIFTGDDNQDGIVDGGDLSDIGNLADYAASGYLPQDINGDGLIDGSDLSSAGNNADLAVGIYTP